MKKHTLVQIIDAATRPLYNDATIDLILTNTNKVQSKGTLDWSLSDHLPTFIDIKKKKNKFQKTSFTGRSYKNFNEQELTRLFQEHNINLILEMTDVAEAWKRLRLTNERVLDQNI